MNSFKQIKVIATQAIITNFLSFVIILPVAAQVNLMDVHVETSKDAFLDAEIDLTFYIDHGFYIQLNEPYDEYLIPTIFKITNCEGMNVTQIDYVHNTKGQTSEIDLQEAFSDEMTVRLRGSQTEGPITIAGYLYFQDCDQRHCYFPRQYYIEFGVKASDPFASLEP